MFWENLTEIILFFIEMGFLFEDFGEKVFEFLLSNELQIRIINRMYTIFSWFHYILT